MRLFWGTTRARNFLRRVFVPLLSSGSTPPDPYSDTELFPRSLRHLFPDGAPWRFPFGSTLRRLIDGLARSFVAPREAIDRTYFDLFPYDTRELQEWEGELGIAPSSESTEATRREALAATHAATGGQSPRYIQDVLRGAGFDVYVHEWWESGPPYVARDPREHTNYPLLGLFQCSATTDQVACGEGAECNLLLHNETYYLVNKDGTNRPPPPVPDDPDAWPYFIYIAGETFPSPCSVPAHRREEFERLVLKYRPTQQWVVLIVKWADVFDDTFDDTFQ